MNKLAAFLCLLFAPALYAQTSGLPANGVNDNKLVNSSSTGPLFVVGDSISIPINGGFAQKLAVLLDVPSANQHITGTGSASVPDLLSCNTTVGCSAGGSFPYQIGTMPLTFPLGVTSNSKAAMEFGFNDLSNMGATPTTNQLSYFYGGVKAWTLMYGIPDSQKVAANNTTYCTTTGTWTAATSVPGNGTFPAGTLKSIVPGSTITCTGLNATDAGIIGLKTTGSTTATFTVDVVNAGTTYHVADPYTASTTLNQTAYYTTAWGGISGLYAIGQPGLSGGYTTITVTTASNGSDPVYVVMPYFISPSSGLQNAPAVDILLESRAGCNGACSSVSGALHNDSNTNIMRAAQMAVVNELRPNGLNVSYSDPNATPSGYNSSSTTQTTGVIQYTVSAGGSGYANGNMTFSGCTIQPTATAPISGGVITPGTYYVTTNGACVGGSPTIAFTGGGSGATATASTASDGTHPNDIGGTNIANTVFVNLNSAATTQDHFIPSLFRSLTTTGSGAASLNNGVLNVPTPAATSSAFSALTSGTNTTFAALVGSGASLAPTGTGTIQATNIASTVAVTSPITLAGSGTTASPYTIACPTCGTGSGGTSVSQNSGAAETNLPITGFMPQVCSDVSGSGTVQSCTVANSFTPQTGNCIVYKTTTTNSGTGLTINVDSLGAKSVAVASSTGWTTTLVASTSIPANKPMNLCYDGTNWDASGTGYIPAGTSAKLQYTATDAVPGSPTTWDDEFTGEGSLPVKWTRVLGTGGAQSFINSQDLYLVDTATSESPNYIYQTPPGAGTWEFTINLRHIGQLNGTGYNTGIYLSDGTKLLILKSYSAGGSFAWQVCSSTNVATSICTANVANGTFSSSVPWNMPHYLRVNYDGTNYIWKYSFDGTTYTTAATGASGAVLGALTQVGVAWDQAISGQSLVTWLGWFRRTQ